ncbi:MAG: hypothetical protein C4321_07410, partial [Chloroflexota bacterium]
MKPQSLQDILKSRQQKELQEVFVGRDDQLARFRENLNLASGDDRRWYVAAISGQGGVGKSFLLHRFEEAARERGALTAWTDDTETTAVRAMARLMEALGPNRPALKAFNERYCVYRQRR